MASVQSGYDFHEYFNKRVREGFIDTAGKPIKCECGGSDEGGDFKFEEPDKDGDYFVICLKCDDDIGQWINGEWNPEYY